MSYTDAMKLEINIFRLLRNNDILVPKIHVGKDQITMVIFDASKEMHKRVDELVLSYMKLKLLPCTKHHEETCYTNYASYNKDCYSAEHVYRFSEV